MSTIASSRRTVSLRRPAWLLVATLLAFVAYVVFADTIISTQTSSSTSSLYPAELRTSELSDLGVSWVMLHVLWMTPFVLAAIASFLLARRLRLGTAGPVAVLAAVAVVLAVGYLGVQLCAFRAETTTWGDSDLYAVGHALSLAVGWLGVLPATLLVAVGVARRQISTKVACSVSAAIGLYLVAELLTYLPALGAATLAETTGPPPFLLGFIWAALGVRLLVGRADPAE